MPVKVIEVIVATENGRTPCLHTEQNLSLGSRYVFPRAQEFDVGLPDIGNYSDIRRGH